MPDDLSAIAAPQYPSAVDLALSGGPAMGPVMQSPDASSPEQLQPAQISNQAPPEGATAPLNMPSAAPYMGTPTPPDVKLHMDWIHRAVNATANALAGPTTWQVTKLPDGTVTSTQMPSTGKEKWGEIAAAALTGAAQGFTHSQGPGGLGNAAAAGLQTGLQSPQQQKEQSQETADFQNKQMMSTANRIHLTNQTYMLQQQLKEADLKYSQDVADTLNKETDMLIHSPNAVDLGKVDPNNHDEIMNLAKTNPAAYDAYLGKGNQILRYMPDPTDHKMHMVLTDKTWEQQKNSEAMDALSVGTDKDGVPTMIHTNVPANGGVVGDILNNNAAATTKLAAATKDYADAHAKLNPPVKPTPLPKGIPETRAAASAARAAGNIPEADRLDQLAEQQIKDDLRMHPPKTGKGKGTSATDAAAEAPSRVRAAGGSIDDALNAIPLEDRGNVRAMGEGRMPPPNRATKDGMRMTAMVNAVYPDWDATQYKTYQDARTRFTSGKEGDGLAFILTARNHLARMAKNIPPNVSIPFGIGSVVNWAKNASQQSTDPQLKAFYDDLHAVGSEVAAAYKGSVITDAENDRMEKLLNGTDSPEAMKGAIDEFNQLLAGKATSYQQQWNAAMPRGVASPNGLLEKAVSGAITAPTDGNNVQWPKAPAPQGQVYAYLPGHPVTPIPKGNAKQFLHDHPEGQVNQQ